MAASLAALVLLLVSVLGPWESGYQATKWSQHSGAGLASSCYVGNDGNLMQCATIVGEAGDVVEAGEQEGSEAWSDAREGVLGRDLDKDNSAVPPFQGCAANIYQIAEHHQEPRPWRLTTGARTLFYISAPHQDRTLDEDECCATQGGVHVTHERVDMEIVQKKTAARGLVAVSAVK